MKKHLETIVFLAAFNVYLSKCDEISISNATAAPNNILEIQLLGEANQKFTFELLKSLQNINVGPIAVSNQKNLVFSPFSIGHALSLLLLGAGGETFKELLNTLHYRDLFRGSNQITPKDQEILHSVILNATQTLKHYGNSTVEISNGIYPDESIKIDPAFAQKASKYYAAHVQAMNYKMKSYEAAKSINSYVSKATKGLIRDLLPPGSLNSDTRVVIVDTIYFKSDWESPFNPKNTAKRSFIRDDKKVEKIKMMHDIRLVQYGETRLKNIAPLTTSVPDQKIKVLKMQYMNPNLAMFFVLPEKRGLTNLINVLSTASFASLINIAENVMVDIALPIFITSYDVTLSRTLKNLGLRSLFE
ncbi:heterochromatin-associated protein MENT-like isoform X2 [Gordionus sp. m RMFG-2023]